MPEAGGEIGCRSLGWKETLLIPIRAKLRALASPHKASA